MTATKYNAGALGLAVALCVPLASCVSVQEHEQLNRKARRVEANNAALTQDLATRSRAVTDLKAKVHELTQDVTLSEDALEQRRQELGNAQQKINELKGSLAQFRTAIDEERRTVQRHRQKAIDLTAERNSAVKNAHNLTEQLNHTTTEVKNLSTRTRDLAALRDSLVKKITRLSAAKSTLEENFAALVRKQDELNALVTSLGRKVAQQDEVIENNSIERGRLNTLSQSLKTGATTQKIALEKLRKRLTQTALSLEQARAEKGKALARLAAMEKETGQRINSLATDLEQARTEQREREHAGLLQQELTQTALSLEQARAEKGKALARLAAMEKEAGQRINSLATDLEQARTEKQTLQYEMDAGEKELSEKTTQLEEQRRNVAGKLVVEPYWKWIFATVVGLGAMGWIWGKFKA